MTTAERNFDYACEALRLAIETACNPENWVGSVGVDGYIPYYGKPESRCLWYVRYVMQRARALGLYPTTAQIEADLKRRQAA